MTPEATKQLAEAERNVARAVNEGGLSPAENLIIDAILNLIEALRCREEGK